MFALHHREVSTSESLSTLLLKIGSLLRSVSGLFNFPGRHWASILPARRRLALLEIGTLIRAQLLKYSLNTKTNFKIKIKIKIKTKAKTKTKIKTKITSLSPAKALLHTTPMTQPNLRLLRFWISRHGNPRSCTFTSCRKRCDVPRPYYSWDAYFSHTKRLHFLTRSTLASSTAAQVGAFPVVLDARNSRLCNICADARGNSQPCLSLAPCLWRHAAQDTFTITRIEGRRCVLYTPTHSLSAGDCD